MPDRTIPADAVEYLEVAVQSEEDLTTGTVEVGFSDTTTPVTWHVGEWTGERRVIGDQATGFSRGWVSRFLVGTGTLDLPVGVYRPWVRVIIGAETIIRDTEDVLTVT